MFCGWTQISASTITAESKSFEPDYSDFFSQIITYPTVERTNENTLVHRPAKFFESLI